MENIELLPQITTVDPPETSNNQFMVANTIPMYLEEMKRDHIIPVYVKDNEPLISHTDFIDITQEVVLNIFSGERILSPKVRVSHPIKGRVPEARNKPANQLNDWEKTLYYERMAFIIEVPSIQSEIDGNTLSLTVGGVKSYSQDNLFSKKGNEEHFKIFIGFKNQVCTNLCVWSDGYVGDLRVSHQGMLKGCIQSLLERYNFNYHLSQMAKLPNYSLTEHQFAQLLGRCRMYGHLPANFKSEIAPLHLVDTQITSVCRDYYKDESFCRDLQGNINLWKLYNLLTGANKSSYIDNFLDRGVNAYHFVESVRHGVENNESNWFLQ